MVSSFSLVNNSFISSFISSMAAYFFSLSFMRRALSIFLVIKEEILSTNSGSGVRVSYSIFSSPISLIIFSSNLINSFMALCPNINASSITSSDTCLALDSTILIASLVPATVNSNSDFSNSSGVGLMMNFPSTLPTFTPAIGPLNGIFEMDTAKDEANIAVNSGEQS